MSSILPGIRAVSLSLLLPLIIGCVTVSSPSAPAAPNTPAAPAAPTAPDVVKSLLTDVDGDGRYDRVDLLALGPDQFGLTVTTAKSVTSSVTFSAKLAADMPTTNVLYGAVPLDGAKGSELIVQLWDRDDPKRADFAVDLAVYTWRSGRLVAEKAPKAPAMKTWHLGDIWQRANGYRVFDRHGRRWVDVSDLTLKYNPWRWVGKITRSVWKRGAWVKVSSRKVSLSRTKAEPYLRYDGAPVLLGMANTDIDGDAVADELRYYRYHDGDPSRYKVKVTPAAGKVVTKKLPAEGGDPLLGAADVDGIPGRELVFQAFSEDPLWRVLTWRAGKLVDEPAPAMCGRPAGGAWQGCNDETADNLAFSTVDGKRYVHSTEFDSESGDLATYDRSVWEATRWVKLNSWSEHLTPEQVAAFRRGFSGLDFIKP